MFSDEINLIVPEIDQDGVKARSNVRDVLDKTPELIKFKDPHYRYDGWANKPKMGSMVEEILRTASEQIDREGIVAPKKDKYGNLKAGQEPVVDALIKGSGWKYIAAEKFPARIQGAVFDSNCAARAGEYLDAKTGNTIEHNGVVCHPLLADFILCRMAREASFQEGLPSITFGGINYMDHLLDDEIPLNSPEQALMQASLELFVPDNLQNLKIDEFLSVRNEYSELRRSVRSYLDSMVIEGNLNLSSLNQDVFVRSLTDVRSKIKTEMSDVTDAVGRHRFMSNTALAVEAAATIGGTGLGIIFSGAEGALAGAGLGFAGGKFAHKLSTVGNSLDGRLRSVAMTKARVERRGLQKRWDAPSYWQA